MCIFTNFFRMIFPQICVTPHPSCSSSMNTKSRVSVLQLSRMGLQLCTSKPPGYSARPPSFPAPSSCLSNISPCRRSYSSSVKVRSYLQYLKRKVIPGPSPPYCHVCQVGDPVLRSHAAAVDPAAVTGPEIQKVINTMVKVMRKFKCVGLSAPQIGVPLRIMALEYPQEMLEESSPASREVRGLSAQLLRIFVNPKLRVLDGRTVLFQEACESISGFSATVPRYLSVEVSGMDVQGSVLLFPMLSQLQIYVTCAKSDLVLTHFLSVCMLTLQVWMRRVKESRGWPAGGRLVSSNMR